MMNSWAPKQQFDRWGVIRWFYKTYDLYLFVKERLSNSASLVLKLDIS